MNDAVICIKQSFLYDGLWVSKDGRVFKYNKNKLNHLKTVKKRYEHLVYSYKNKRITALVHRAVAHAFCNKQFAKNVINHKDANGLNNDYKNLEWVTQQENIHYRDSQNRTSKGLKHYKAKFNQAQINQIKKDSRPSRVIAKEFGVAHSTIARIKSGSTWS